jgi:hypothetical protein
MRTKCLSLKSNLTFAEKLISVTDQTQSLSGQIAGGSVTSAMLDGMISNLVSILSTFY